jgi:hypothetical protein
MAIEKISSGKILVTSNLWIKLMALDFIVISRSCSSLRESR